MAHALHGQPPAIQLFCEHLADGVIDFYRRNPIVPVITGIAIGILGGATCVFLITTFPITAPVAITAGIAFFGSQGGELFFIMPNERHLGNRTRACLLITLTALFILGTAILFLPVLLPGIAVSTFIEAIAAGVYCGTAGAITELGMPAAFRYFGVMR